MAQFALDPKDRPLGVPGDFTPQWAELSAEIVDTGDFGRVLRFSGSGSTRRAISWDEPGLVTDAEMFLRVVSRASNNDENLDPTFRGQGAEGSETGYKFGPNDNGTVAQRLDGGSITDIADTTSVTMGRNEEWSMRASVAGASVKFRLWRSSDPEPSTWLLETGDRIAV